MTATFDVFIVGGGMAGLFTAYSLRRRGLRVAVSEARTFGNDAGSSYGETRMFREMYSDPFLCEMSQRANELWQALERESGTSLRRSHGLLFYGEPFDEETIEGSIPGAARVMRAQGIPFEEHSATSIEKRWPLRPSHDHVGLFEPTAGAVLSERVLRVLVVALKSAGVRLIEHASVESIDLSSSHASIRTRDGQRYEAAQVVCCAGAWTNELLEPLGLELPLELWQMLWAHYEVEAADAARYPQWFCFQRPVGDDGGLYYGFPGQPDSTGTARIKVGIDWAPQSMRARRVRELPTSPQPRLVELLDTFIERQLPAVGRRLETRCSPYTMTADANFIVARLGDRISTFAGGSGQAFKFGPLLGQVLASIALDEDPGVPLDPWSLTRASLSSHQQVA